MPPERGATQIAPAVLAFCVLALGFAIEMGPAGQGAGRVVAQAIATLADPLLRLAGLDLIRDGVELRSASEGWAIRVSEVCDGMGLVVALLAVLVAVHLYERGTMRQTALKLALGFAAIQAFNLFRVVALAMSLDRWPDGFRVLHDLVFPYATVLIIGLAVLPLWRLLIMAALMVGLVLLWVPIAGVASTLLVPLANSLLPLGLTEVGDIALRSGGWSVGTQLLAATDPVQLYVAPLEPSHFTLALPVIGAVVLMARRPLWLPIALALMLAALTVAALVAVMALAAAHDPVMVLVPDGTGAFTAEPYGPREGLRATLRLTQNTLVHFLLLVLPLLILFRFEARP